MARQDPDYLEAFNKLAAQDERAEQVIAKFRAEECRYEATRSLLSFSRTAMDVLQG